MHQVIIAKKEGERPLLPLFAGWEMCAPSHSFGPYVRAHYLIHICLSGKGVLRDCRGEHSVREGELFIIRPGEVTTYVADESEPWCYAWLAFRGEDAAPFLDVNSVCPSPDGLGERICSLVDKGCCDGDVYLSLLYGLMHVLFFAEQMERVAQDRLQEICRYIRYNYMKELRVGELSRTFGFERSYLYRLFKEQLGVSVKAFITAVRMQHAKEFLAAGHAVGKVARMVGYEDVLCFSHAFKKHFGITASQQRGAGKQNLA